MTSPPYWTLKEYRRSEGQLGWIEDYGEFLEQLDDVWRMCHRALTPGGRLICVVGDVCLSRRKNSGRHTVVPLHASIQERCRKLGFDNLAPIIWSKIANATYEVDRGAGGFLGKPYEPNAVIKNDIEFRESRGDIENPPDAEKAGGISKTLHGGQDFELTPQGELSEALSPRWTDIKGASTRKHPAPYPVELAERLIRMFAL